MNIPGFSAETSLYKTSKLYHRSRILNQGEAAIQPAQWDFDYWPVVYEYEPCRWTQTGGGLQTCGWEFECFPWDPSNCGYVWRCRSTPIEWIWECQLPGAQVFR